MDEDVEAVAEHVRGIQTVEVYNPERVNRLWMTVTVLIIVTCLNIVTTVGVAVYYSYRFNDGLNETRTNREEGYRNRAAQCDSQVQLHLTESEVCMDPNVLKYMTVASSGG